MKNVANLLVSGANRFYLVLNTKTVILMGGRGRMGQTTIEKDGRRWTTDGDLISSPQKIHYMPQIVALCII